MRELKMDEVRQVSGGNDWMNHGMAAIALGLAGGPTTFGFGFAIGASMMVVGYFAER